MFLFHLVLKGTVRLLFQPAEEGGAGASHMIQEGALGDAEAIFGMHIDDKIPTGTVASLAGPVLAAVSFFMIKVEGKGGHAAEPHASVDPVIAASFTILALQQLVSREADPVHSQVCYCYPFIIVAFIFYFLQEPRKKIVSSISSHRNIHASCPLLCG